MTAEEALLQTLRETIFRALNEASGFRYSYYGCDNDFVMRSVMRILNESVKAIDQYKDHRDVDG